MKRTGKSIWRTAIWPWIAAATCASLLVPLGVAAAGHSTSGEIIRERHPDGRVKIEREVTTDNDGNYVNHGAWRMWDADGNLIVEGRHTLGRREGAWTRWLNRDDSPLLSELPFGEFQAPFESRATFQDGRLHGEWIVVDAKKRKCSSVALRDGKRDGLATLWLPGGKIYREATFRNGVAVGEVRERGVDGRLVTVATYVDGHELVNNVTHFTGTFRKKTDASYLTAAVIETSPDDFWQFRFAEFAARGEDQRHGAWRSWHANGQLELEGCYEFGRENGTFTWWHANGQKAAEGNFVDGQLDGTWVWWHANGQKASQGDYHYGQLTGLWRGWSADGQLVERHEFAKGELVSRNTQTARTDQSAGEATR
jgi:antitoxin component YwqK of YwqJK toxin-antitoxin module